MPRRHRPAGLGLLAAAAVAILLLSLSPETVSSSDASFVKVLSSENFDRLMGKGTWLVQFYAPWCGHCKRLAPVFEQVASELQNEVNVAKCDATVERGLAARFPVSGYPVSQWVGV